MKKEIAIVFILGALIVGLFILTGCDKEKEETVNDELSSYILSLELDESQYIQVKVDYPQSNDIQLIEDKENTNHLTIKNEKKNYELKLSLLDELEDTYYESQESDKENDKYTEAKFANNDGYYYMFGKSTVMGNVLIDTLTDNDYKFIFFEFSLLNENNNILEIFKEKEVQNILSSFGHRYTSNISSTQQTTTKTTESVIGQWAYLSYVYTFNADGTGNYNASGTPMNFTYEADGEKLSILYTGNTAPTVLNYRITGNKLIIEDSFGSEVEYTKK